MLMHILAYNAYFRIYLAYCAYSKICTLHNGSAKSQCRVHIFAYFAYEFDAYMAYLHIMQRTYTSGAIIAYFN